MFVDGKKSVRIVCPLAKVATALPILARWTFHVQGTPEVPFPETLLLFVAVRSGAVTVTVSLHELLLLLLSVTTLLGSTMHAPPVGFAKVPMAVGVAVKLTSNAPVLAATVTAVPAEHVSTLAVMLQFTVPPMPPAPEILAEP